eukprot:6540857-Prymnesium_polylepis.1
MSMSSPCDRVSAPCRRSVAAAVGGLPRRAVWLSRGRQGGRQGGLRRQGEGRAQEGARQGGAGGQPAAGGRGRRRALGLGAGASGGWRQRARQGPLAQ